MVDAYHRRGIGRELLTALADRAAQRGLRTLTADVLAENVGAQALLRAVFPDGPTRRAHGVLTLTCRLPDHATRPGQGRELAVAC